MELGGAPVSTPDFWDGLYARGHDGWELGEATPPLRAWLDGGGSFEAAAAGGPPRIAVPGCGRGHDTRLLARRGCRVWGFDFAEAAVAESRALAEREGVQVTIEQRDVFALGEDYRAFFDGVWEYTCFCAIDPARREEYVRVLHAILRPGGRLLACFFPLGEGADGPPFPVALPSIERTLGPSFATEEAGAPARSAERRRGREWLVQARRRPG